MEALSPVGAFGTHKARSADVTGQEKPDPRQGDTGVSGQTLDDDLQDSRKRAFRSDLDGEREQAFGFHPEIRPVVPNSTLALQAIRCVKLGFAASSIVGQTTDARTPGAARTSCLGRREHSVSSELGPRSSSFRRGVLDAPCGAGAMTQKPV